MQTCGALYCENGDLTIVWCQLFIQYMFNNSKCKTDIILVMGI